MATVEEKLGRFQDYFNVYTDERDSNRKRFLLHVRPSATAKELKVYLTEGADQWHFNVNEKSFNTNPAKSKVYAQFLDDFHGILSKNQFSLTRIASKETNKTLIRFEMPSVDTNYYFQLNDAYEPVNELINLCFDLTEKCLKLENESSRSGNNQSPNEAKRSESREKTDTLVGKKNFAGGCMSSAQHTQRKLGMSIINPHSKKRKVPKGRFFSKGNQNCDEFT
jgi:hypothetical protein